VIDYCPIHGCVTLYVGFLQKQANCAGERVAAHALAIFVIEEGVRLGADGCMIERLFVSDPSAERRINSTVY
jgi:hypothetical protein